MQNLRGRYIFDFIITALLVVEMLFQLTGDFLHEVLGMAFFVTIIIHLILSKKWIGATTSKIKAGKKMKGMNWVRAILGMLLAVTMLVLMVSSLVISNVLSTATGFDLTFGNYGYWVMIHTASSYALCIITAVHLAIHWAPFVSAFKIPYDPSRRAAINTGVTAVTGVAMVGLGIAGANALGIGSSSTTAGEQQATDATSNAAAQNSANDSGEFWSGTTDGNRKVKGGKGSSSTSSNGTGGMTSNLGSSSSSSSSATTSTDGICPLCNKKCPLSAPKCNRPYDAGLI